MLQNKFIRRKNFDIYRKVIELRKKEFSYTEIQRETGIAKSTINNWLTRAGMTLSREHLEIQAKKRIENYVIGTAASKVTRKRRKDIDTQNFIQENKKYFQDPFFVAGIMLYQAEGSKGDSNGFSNSDFRLILIYIKFLERYLFLNRNRDMVFLLYIHETRKTDLSRITNFWIKKLQINNKAIKTSWKHNIVTKNRINQNYVGQFEVRIHGVSYFTSKLLSVSDIILKKYQKV
jgi:hypothetical protein